MQEKSISSYFLFGASIRYLQDAPTGTRVHGSSNILQNIDIVFQMISDLNLVVCDHSFPARDLVDLREKLSNTPTNYSLTQLDAMSLSKIMLDLKNIIHAETASRFAYIVTDKKIDTKKLVFNVGSLMDDSIFDKLDGISRYDFMEAGKCIAFERSTAAAFHLLRGTESVLRSYYFLHIKRNRLDVLMWGPIVDALRNKQRNKPPKELLDNLDNIKDNYRNPTQHPDKIYDINDAQSLFWICIDVVNKMIKEIKKN